jgi:hypothetical protein
MRFQTKVAALVVAVVLCVAGSSAGASAAQFTASSTGSISGKATTTQVFTTSSGSLKCTAAAGSGTVSSLASTELHSTIKWSGCTFLGFAVVEVSPATVRFTASGQVDLLNAITISIPLAGCSVTIPAQTFSATSWSNIVSKLRAIKNWVGIHYNSTGGICGSPGTNGTFIGSEDYELVGGTLSFDP